MEVGVDLLNILASEGNNSWCCLLTFRIKYMKLELWPIKLNSDPIISQKIYK